MHSFPFILLLLTLPVFLVHAQKPLAVGVAGLTHGHVHWAFQSARRGDIEIVGIAEPDRKVAERYARQYDFPMEKVYPTLSAMLAATRPAAVAAFGNIHDHLAVVEACAPRGIHVMVEKPLAISGDHAEKMAALARQHSIQLITNYETTWYETNHMARQWLKDGRIGRLSKMVIHDGHQGPKEINVQPEFLAWLTDPEKNGGGAIIDFGCYGANLATWLMGQQPPISVTAVTQTLKPEVYEKVDDEATIVLVYPRAQAIIQASWNWPFSRKDMELYGQTGYIIARDKTRLVLRESGQEEEVQTTGDRPSPYDDPFRYLAAVVEGRIRPDENDLGSLENNLIVMKILDAARESARTGKTVVLKP